MTSTVKPKPDTRIQCPYCKVRTWSTDYAGFMRDHDRPDGRRCLRAAREADPNSNVCAQCRPQALQATPFPEGSRVRVKIVHPERYAVGSVDALNGRVGTVECEIPDYNWSTGKGPARLVRFDNPIPAWWSYGSPVSAFHFELYELEALT